MDNDGELNRIKAEIREVEKRISRIRGEIDWDQNRLRQANTVIERGF